ncbi:MAG: hypothetical protein K9L84_05300 [Candidatus Omnitrophica bacterium]|nr:hypothetical protein [Candidatus Omnitrophota bacterium]MCF7894458.1 hypothetical protein [Candidatus Omnitrophota bacterium]
MKSKKPMIVTITVVILLGLGLYAVNNGYQVKVLGAKSGLVVGYRGDIPKIKETEIITLKDDLGFGWIIVTEEIDKDISWEEVVVFPEKPKKLLVTKSTKISRNGKKAITKRSSNLADGIIYNVWGLSKGDPLGQYQIKIYTQGKLLKQFSFTAKAI